MTGLKHVPRFDVVSLGETMLRFSVPSGARLDAARALELEIGGAESNVCVTLARLGRRSAWMSRLPDHALGNNVMRILKSDGVDVSAVKQVANERIGTYFIEYATAPRSIQVIYDRANSAVSKLSVADIDWDYLLATRLIHLTGITAAVSESCYEVLRQVIKRARAAGVTISFDVNHRAKMWDSATAGAKLRPLIAQADILFCKGADATLLFDCTGQPQDLMTALKALTGAKSIFCTFGDKGAAMLRGNEFVMQPALPVQIVDRIGSGDAFAAGVLDGWLDDDLHIGLKRGVALAAIALSQFGDGVLTSRRELDAVMARQSGDVAR